MTKETGVLIAGVTVLAAAALSLTPPAVAQSAPGYGRITLFDNYMQTTWTDGGPNSN